MSALTHDLRNQSFYKANGEVSILGEQAADRIEALEAALDRVLVGVNHIATHRSDKWPDVGTDHETALRILCATPEYDMWCCWNAAMLVRDTLTEGSDK